MSPRFSDEYCNELLEQAAKVCNDNLDAQQDEIDKLEERVNKVCPSPLWLCIRTLQELQSWNELADYYWDKCQELCRKWIECCGGI